jgi:hypothetical protein
MFGKGDNEMVVLFMLVYDEYAVKKLSVFKWHRCSKENMCKIIQEVESHSQMTNADLNRVKILVCSHQRLGVRIRVEE